MTATIIDIRADSFLRALRDTGTWDAACDKSGLSTAEVQEMCEAHPKFDLAQVECQLENIEETLIGVVEAAAANARAAMVGKLEVLRETHMDQYRARHGG